MNKRGFTVVELLAVVTLLGVLALVSIPAIDKTIEKNKERLYEDQIKTIIAGAKRFSEENIEILPKHHGETLNLELKDLKVSKTVSSNIKNPKTNKCFYNNMNIIIKRVSNSYQYIVDEKSGSESLNDCEADKSMTVYSNIALYGSTSYVVDINEEFIDPGFYIFGVSNDKSNVSVTIKNSAGTVVDEIDTSAGGTYTIDYNLAIEDNNIDITKTRKVIIDDQYKELLLNGATPVLSEGMIPVTIEDDGTVKKADTTTEWYNYEDKLWANMVLVTDSTRESYKNADANSSINEDDILGYFVWIPRYKYRIPTGGTTTPSTIDIIFQNNTTNKSNGNATTEYLTHPGFTFGDEELNGIWVAKFETTGTADTPTVLPNVQALNSQTISTQFTTALKFNDYGINRDSHMMKNSEWGTVAYLSHSEYGINDEVRINNNSSYITGCGASLPNGDESTDCQIKYGNNISDLPQSTTGNITGIFDMSGGAWERVMGNLNNTLAASGFTEMPESKYYNLYENSSNLTACNGGNCLGHATTETKEWYSDYYAEPRSNNPWVRRGGFYDHTSIAGLFHVDLSNPLSISYCSFRVVIG